MTIKFKDHALSVHNGEAYDRMARMTKASRR